VGTIQPGSDDGCDEELRAVSILPSVRHRQQTGLAVLVLEVLICVREQGSVTDIEKKKIRSRRTSEFLAVDGLAAGAVALGEVATLQHELGDNTMETGTFVSVAVLASR
jgi:hypothetical protein